ERRTRHRKRHPNLRLGRILQPPVLCVSHHPDNFKNGLFYRVIKFRKLCDSHLPSDWVFVPKYFFTNVWFTTASFRAPVTSASVKPLPSTNWIFRTGKYPSLTS